MFCTNLNRMFEENANDLFKFRKFMADEDGYEVEQCHTAAIDKLQTLFPGKKITSYDNYTIGIETDSLYSDNGFDIYELGMVDEEIYAMRNTRDGEVLTFRI